MDSNTTRRQEVDGWSSWVLANSEESPEGGCNHGARTINGLQLNGRQSSSFIFGDPPATDPRYSLAPTVNSATPTRNRRLTYTIETVCSSSPSQTATHCARRRNILQHRQHELLHIWNSSED
ncbi:hypothetical protein SDJN03_29341, partial [Cucurbita argyrosperma subsp. sororia]